MRDVIVKTFFFFAVCVASLASAGTSHIPFSVSFGHEAWIDFTALNPAPHALVCRLDPGSSPAHMFVFENIYQNVDRADLQPGEEKRYVYGPKMDQVHIMFSSEAPARGACELTELGRLSV